MRLIPAAHAFSSTCISGKCQRTFKPLVTRSNTITSNPTSATTEQHHQQHHHELPHLTMTNNPTSATTEQHHRKQHQQQHHHELPTTLPYTDTTEHSWTTISGCGGMLGTIRDRTRERVLHTLSDHLNTDNDEGVAGESQCSPILIA